MVIKDNSKHTKIENSAWMASPITHVLPGFRRGRMGLTRLFCGPSGFRLSGFGSAWAAKRNGVVGMWPDRTRAPGDHG